MSTQQDEENDDSSKDEEIQSLLNGDCNPEQASFVESKTEEDPPTLRRFQPMNLETRNDESSTTKKPLWTTVLYWTGTIVVIAILLLGFLLLFHPHANNKQNKKSSWHEFRRGVHAQEVVANDELDTIAFGELAKRMLPSWYNLTLELTRTSLPNTVQPDDVMELRKALLKTRDLWDIFAPVYYTQTKNNKDDDAWVTIRTAVSEGYKLAGRFRDWKESHVIATPEQIDVTRQALLTWKDDFLQQLDTNTESSLRLAHYMATPLQHSSDTAQHHAHESRFFWKHVPISDRPRPSDPAQLVLRKLVANVQVNTALYYLRASLQFDEAPTFHDSHKDKFHSTYHDFRKVLRCIKYAFEMLGPLLMPNDNSDNTIQTCLVTLDQARDVLGDLNDDWNALEFYVSTNAHPEEQVRLTDAISQRWVDFVQWESEADLENALQSLADQVSS